MNSDCSCSCTAVAFLNYFPTTGVPGRCRLAAVLPPERPTGPSAHRHVVQQQPLQTAESLLLPIAPTGRPSAYVSTAGSQAASFFVRLK